MVPPQSWDDDPANFSILLGVWASSHLLLIACGSISGLYTVPDVYCRAYEHENTLNIPFNWLPHAYTEAYAACMLAPAMRYKCMPTRHMSTHNAPLPRTSTSREISKSQGLCAWALEKISGHVRSYPHILQINFSIKLQYCWVQTLDPWVCSNPLSHHGSTKMFCLLHQQ